MMLFSLSNLLWTALSLIYASSTFYFLFPSLHSTAARYKLLTVNDQGKAHFNSSIKKHVTVMYFLYSDTISNVPAVWPAIEGGQILDIAVRWHHSFFLDNKLFHA